ncbi:MAG: hypothetical protein KAT28_01085 [Candidatus Aenigmarchaeota archaeon]|nr:hypothetical protein [Candidatus Aenigmarchaeota archaeon]
MVNHRETLDKPIPSLEDMIEFAFLLLLPVSLVISWIVDFSAVLICFFLIASSLGLLFFACVVVDSEYNKEKYRMEYSLSNGIFTFLTLVLVIPSIVITYLLKTEFLFLPVYAILLIGFFGFLCNRWIKGLANIG